MQRAVLARHNGVLHQGKIKPIRRATCRIARACGLGVRTVCFCFVVEVAQSAQPLPHLGCIIAALHSRSLQKQKLASPC
jgi:hypothetical protein